MIAATAVMTAGAMLQGAVGFGLAMLSGPFLVALDPRLVPGPLLVAAFLMHGLVTYRDGREVDTSGLGLLLVGRLAGAVPAAVLVSHVPLVSMKLVVGAVVLAGVAMTALRGDVRATRTTLVGAGTVSGFTATVAGMGGPPVALLYQRAAGPRLRGTLAVYFVIGTIVSLCSLAAVGRFAWPELRLSLLLLPGVVLGYSFSHRLALYLDAGYTRRAVLAVSGLAALNAIATALL